MASEKKVFRGWLPKSLKMKDLVCWSGIQLQFNKHMIWKSKGKDINWTLKNWPPKRVTITVEIEDV